jgi:hypothetical protein
MNLQRYFSYIKGGNPIVDYNTRNLVVQTTEINTSSDAWLDAATLRDGFSHFCNMIGLVVKFLVSLCFSTNRTNRSAALDSLVVKTAEQKGENPPVLVTEEEKWDYFEEWIDSNIMLTLQCFNSVSTIIFNFLPNTMASTPDDVLTFFGVS